MKKIPMILLLICPYLFVFLFNRFSKTGFSSSNGEIVLISAYLGMILLIFLPNAIYAFILPKLQYSEQKLLFWNMILKLCNIPIYTLIFFISMLFFIVFIPVIPFLVVFDYILLLPSTMYGISGLRIAYKKKKISKRHLIVGSICQFLFCLDVVSAIVSYFKVRKANKIKLQISTQS